jgi:outer membrane lipoprotein-sorting protein
MMYLLALSLFLAPPSFAKPAPDSKETAAVERLQASLAQTASYEADFTQTVHSKGMGPEDPSSGTLSVIKPDMLRWEDRTSSVTQILNGDEYWELTENKRRKSRTVTYQKGVRKHLAQTSFAVLSGSGKFQDFYKVKLLSESPTEAQLQLIAKAPPHESLIAKIDKNGYVLRSLTTETPDSKVVLEFSQIRRNPRFEPERFRYVKQDGDVFQSRKD